MFCGTCNCCYWQVALFCFAILLLILFCWIDVHGWDLNPYTLDAAMQSLVDIWNLWLCNICCSDRWTVSLFVSCEIRCICCVIQRLKTCRESVHNVYGAVCDTFSSQTLSGFGLCLRVCRIAMMMLAGARIWSRPQSDWEHFLKCNGLLLWRSQVAEMRFV